MKIGIRRKWCNILSVKKIKRLTSYFCFVITTMPQTITIIVIKMINTTRNVTRLSQLHRFAFSVVRFCKRDSLKAFWQIILIVDFQPISTDCLRTQLERNLRAKNERKRLCTLNIPQCVQSTKFFFFHLSFQEFRKLLFIELLL